MHLIINSILLKSLDFTFNFAKIVQYSQFLKYIVRYYSKFQNKINNNTLH